MTEDAGASFILSPLLVVGDAPEITLATTSAPILRLSVDASHDRISPVALVFDLRSKPVAELAAIRASPSLLSVPLLIVSGKQIPEAVFLLLRAEDGIVLTEHSTAQLTRRLAILVELGRARLPASVAEHVAALADARAEIESLYRMLIDNQRFDHAILDGVEVGIVTTDDEGIITFVNRSAAQLLEVSPAAAGVAVEQVHGLLKGPHELLGNETRRSLAYPLRTKDGVELDLELSVSRGESSKDDRVGFFFIFRDVREEKQRETERARFERLAAMGTMVAGFAHEVRNPIAAMRSIAEELAEELRDGGATMPHVRLMLQMIERVERLVTTSLQFGRPAVPRRAPQRPWVIATSAAAELHPRLRSGGGRDELQVEAEPDLPEVNVDERQIAQALVILLHNALDATGSPARVRMRVRRTRPSEPEIRARKSDPPPPASVRFEVIDDGPGISPEILGRIFDPFFTTKPSGTGLGLSIAQQIVSENGARLEVVSSPGSTTSFSIVVPVDAAASG